MTSNAEGGLIETPVGPSHHPVMRSLPVVIAVIAAVASIVAAIISWNASNSSTEKDYVSLAMQILADEDSTQPSRTWAVGIVSKLSPVDVPKELQSGLLTGEAVLPSELDPLATRNEILDCLKPLLESKSSGPVEAAPLPLEQDRTDDLTTAKAWMIFAVTQTGQLEKANGRIETYEEVLDICVRKPTTDEVSR